MQDRTTIYWHRWTTLAALLLAWSVLAVWQWQEFKTERDKERAALRRQAESVFRALVGGVRSHRRLGRFVEEQIQSVLDELAASQEVLAAAVVSPDGILSMTAGNAVLLDLSQPLEPGGRWEESGFFYAATFRVMSEMPGPARGLGPGPGMRPDPGSRTRQRPETDPTAAANRRGEGPNSRSGRWWEDYARPPQDMEMPPPIMGRLFALLLLDRGYTDRQIVHYAWLRLLVVAAGGAAIVSVVFVWRATVRLADARGREKLLENEARHLRDLSRAATGLAHETRNPLGLIRGWTQRWMQKMSEEAGRRQARAVIEECDRVTARINQFLAFARPCSPQLAEVRPAEVIAELAALVEPDLEAKKLTLDIGACAPNLAIRADREMLRQALFNLIQNAVEFSPEGGAIDVRCLNGENGSARIELSDRGPGVPAEAVELLFTPYHTTRANGAGLGLAIVRRIAAAHGWRSGYSPRAGGGAIFWIEVNGE
ncbi:MAG: hypothetical protein JW959_00335 [Pirellulales bacterium]|nr:hypothetical protein [Pirellulales bacterium]